MEASIPSASGRPPRPALVLVPSLILLAATAARGASYRSTNFAVEAPSAQSARRVAEAAEGFRKSFAVAWLGRELPSWPAPCPIKVKLTDGEAGGLTTFTFDRGKVSDQRMTVEGRLDRILTAALPHEVTHTVLAAYFGGPMPRWADEGACLLSEDDREIRRHERLVMDLLARQGEMPLARLFRVEQYPRDLWGFYGQGYSVSRFLVETGGRPKFLRFVRDGMAHGWDAASKAHYGLADCRELDRAWRSWYRTSLAARRDTTPVVVTETAVVVGEAGGGN